MKIHKKSVDRARENGNLARCNTCAIGEIVQQFYYKFENKRCIIVQIIQKIGISKEIHDDLAIGENTIIGTRRGRGEPTATIDKVQMIV